MKTYAVYVKDANGWDKDCQDSGGVFFGSEAYWNGGKYVHPVDGGDSTAGHIEIKGHRAAVALRNELQRSGDWTLDDETIRRPVYAIREVAA